MLKQRSLTNRQAAEIRNRWANKPTIKRLAHEFGVSTAVIQNVLRGQQYREQSKFNIENQSLSGERLCAPPPG